jgi:hypothetical protein
MLIQVLYLLNNLNGWNCLVYTFDGLGSYKVIETLLNQFLEPTSRQCLAMNVKFLDPKNIGLALTS